MCEIHEEARVQKTILI